MKTKVVVSQRYYEKVWPFWSPVAIILMGIALSLLGDMGAWPTTIGFAVALVICILIKNKDEGTKKFFGGLAFWSFFAGAFLLNIFSYIATHVQNWV